MGAAEHAYLFHTLFRLASGLGLLIHFMSNLLQSLLGGLSIQRLLLILSKDGGEELGQNAAQHQVSVCDSWVPILPVSIRRNSSARTVT